jgi:hypothetical protein
MTIPMKGVHIMQVRNDTTDVIIPSDQAARFAIIKADLDLAWVKIENGMQQEAEGASDFISNTLGATVFLFDWTILLLLFFAK